MVSGFTKQLNLLPHELVVEFYGKSKNFVKEIWNCGSSEDIVEGIAKLKKLNKEYR